MVKRLHTNNKILILLQPKNFRLLSVLSCISELTVDLIYYKCIQDQMWVKEVRQITQGSESIGRHVLPRLHDPWPISKSGPILHVS